MKTPLFELFWENSKLNKSNNSEFNKMQNSYASKEKGYAPFFQFPKDDVVFERLPFDSLMRTMQKRRSNREFSKKPITEKKLGFLLSSFIETDSEKRSWASAGGLYPVEVFCMVNNCVGKLNREVVYYNADNHSVSIVNDLDEWASYKNW